MTHSTILTKVDFSQSPVAFDFLQDTESSIVGIRGPYGSGKSVASCLKIWQNAMMQPHNPADNIRYSRFAVIRNTYPELISTTINTWKEWFPPVDYGPIRMAPPITHTLKIPPKDDGTPGIHCEVMFIALNRDEDIRKLLSLELTGAFFNEAREIPLSLVRGARDRLGRYPPKKITGGKEPYNPQIILDTNSMDADHWYAKMEADKETCEKNNWKFYVQPGAVIEVKNPKGTEAEREAKGLIHAGNTWWRINPLAENRNNLGRKDYYHRMLAGSPRDEIGWKAANELVFVVDGRPVWPEYQAAVMGNHDGAEPIPGNKIIVGMDFGLTPAAVLGQKFTNGRWHVFDEIVSEDLHLTAFADYLLEKIETEYRGYEFEFWGDPAGNQRGYDGQTAFDVLRGCGIVCRPTKTNKFGTRREAGAAPMTRMVEGGPGLLVHSRCKTLNKSLMGGYCFRREEVRGKSGLFKDVPDKNAYSHVGDAYGYMMTGGGEYRGIVDGKRHGVVRDDTVFTAYADWDPLDGRR